MGIRTVTFHRWSKAKENLKIKINFFSWCIQSWNLSYNYTLARMPQKCRVHMTSIVGDCIGSEIMQICCSWWVIKIFQKVAAITTLNRGSTRLYVSIVKFCYHLQEVLYFPPLIVVIHTLSSTSRRMLWLSSLLPPSVSITISFGRNQNQWIHGILPWPFSFAKICIIFSLESHVPQEKWQLGLRFMEDLSGKSILQLTSLLPNIAIPKHHLYTDTDDHNVW